MTTEYIGPEFRPIFNAAMAAWWAGNCEGIEPLNNWQLKITNGAFWCDTYGECPTFDGTHVHRFKPAPRRTVTIGYIDLDGGNEFWKKLVAPETVAPVAGLAFFLARDSKNSYRWRGTEEQLVLLRAGLVFLAIEDAQAMTGWLAACRRGGA